KVIPRRCSSRSTRNSKSGTRFWISATPKSKSPMQLKDLDFAALDTTLSASLAAVRTSVDLEMLKRDWLSKDGTIKTLFKQLRDVDPEQKPVVAGKLNELKTKLETFVAAKEEELARAKLEESTRSEFIDLSLPSYSPGLGSRSLIARIERQIFSLLK